MEHATGRSRIEWPTIAVAIAIYAGFFALTSQYHALAWWIVAPLGGYLVAWHGSLQHEVAHGHPTRSRAFNEALVYPSLWLWLPFRVYRDLHERHHRSAAITDPLDDPESFYVEPGAWRSMGRLRRALLVFNNTAIGRLTVGPPIAVGAFLAAEPGRVARGGARELSAWGHHAAGCALVLGWVVGACGIPLVEYLALFVAPGLSLTLLRSFAEHRADPDPDRRTAVVEAGPALALLFLNNNLHVIHHRAPGLPWYALPRAWRAERDARPAAGGGDRYSGYAQVLWRHALRPREPVAHPG